MTVKELIAKLNEVNGDLNVVLTVYEDGGVRIFDDVWIDLGWEPSGQCSIESKTLIGS